MNSELETILKEFGYALTTEIDVSNAPKLEIVDAEDGSVLIEWHFADRRLGFNIEPCEGQSGWYFAVSKNSGGQCGAGLLASLDMSDLVQWMFKKTVSNGYQDELDSRALSELDRLIDQGHAIDPLRDHVEQLGAHAPAYANEVHDPDKNEGSPLAVEEIEALGELKAFQ